MTRARGLAGLTAAALAGAVLLAPAQGRAHPMGNFSISHYTGIRVLADAIELRYLVDLAEIPTFQEIQDGGFSPEVGHPALDPYLARRATELGAGLVLALNGRPLALESVRREVLFTPGAGGLPTMKIGLVYRARPGGPAPAGPSQLAYGDQNFPGRVGWKEIVAQAGPGVVLLESSVPERDRSRELADYPADLLDSPPQVLEAALTFARDTPVARTAPDAPAAPPARSDPRGPPRPARAPRPPTAPAAAPGDAPVAPPLEQLGGEPPRGGPPLAADLPLGLETNRRATSGNAFTDLIAAPEMSARILLFAALVAAALGAFHALEPGHGKTVVAAYLVGSRGTARHALLLGLIVTLSHTAGVYLLGGVTLYASRYMVPERLFPWLGALSGLIIAGVGLALFIRRWAGDGHGHSHAHGHAHGRPHEHGHGHLADHDRDHGHPPEHDNNRAHGHSHPAHHDQGGDRAHDHHHAGAHEHGPAPAGTHHHEHGHRHHADGGQVSFRELLALGVTGGIVPCPAALVVLLSAVALHRVRFGLFLIVAFSVGLAGVLIAIGLLTVYARRWMARFHGEGPLIAHWLPLTSSAVITMLGVAIAVQAIAAGGLR